MKYVLGAILSFIFLITLVVCSTNNEKDENIIANIFEEDNFAIVTHELPFSTIDDELTDLDYEIERREDLLKQDTFPEVFDKSDKNLHRDFFR